MGADVGNRVDGELRVGTDVHRIGNKTKRWDEAARENFSRDFMDKNTLSMDKPRYFDSLILFHPSSLYFTLSHSISLH